MICSVAQFVSWMGVEKMHESVMPVHNVVIDSRRAAPGSVFFALKGEHYDGHDYVLNALAKGAVLAVTESNYKKRDSWPLDARIVEVENTVAALQRAATAYRGQFDIPVVGITGSNGKTTTKDMVTAVLSQLYTVSNSPGNLNNHLGVPLSIFTWKENSDIAVVEIGTNHFGEIKRLCEIARPTHGLITNIGKGHLEFFKDLAGVARAKAELLEALPIDGTAYLNGDDALLRMKKNCLKNTVLYGFGPDCDVTAKILAVDNNGHTALSVDDQEIRVPLLGRHNLYNALAAIVVGRSFHVGWHQIRHALQQFAPVNQRMQVMTIQGIIVLNDAYNANPTSMTAALETLKEMPVSGKKFAVLGDMAEMGEASFTEHVQVGVFIAKHGFDGFYSYGPAMRKACEEALRLGCVNCQHFENQQAMVDTLTANLKSGDVVLVKGSRSMAMEKVVEGLSVCLRQK